MWFRINLIPICLLCFVAVDGYKPVIIIHGILDKPGGMDQFEGFIDKYHPGTNVTIVNLFNGWQSIAPLWLQVKKFAQVLAGIGNNSADGIQVIGYSQGGLIARGILSSMTNHHVDTFISLSSPQMGQYGDTSYLQWLFPANMKADLYKVLYTNYGQRISVGNYWNDPHEQGLYRNHSKYLAVLNNDTIWPNPLCSVYKRNFLRINRLVLIGGPDDGVITPWQSSHFGFYDENENVVEMKDQKVFEEDTFGLQTLNRRSDLTVYTVPHVEHLQWHKNETIFVEYILPWLT